MKVRVLQECFIGGSLQPAGKVIEYDGPRSAWMEPVEQPDAEDAPRRGRRSREVTEE